MGMPQTIDDWTAERVRALPDDATLLVAIPRAGEPARMLLVRRVDASRGDMLLVGELRTEHLWVERTGSAWVCTVTAAGTALHCPADALALQRPFMRGQQAASQQRDVFQ